jgi:hypothetical protein
VSRRALITIAAVDAFIAAFVVVGVASGGESSQEPTARETQIRLSQTAALPALTEDPAVVARRQARACAERLERARAARRRAAAAEQAAAEEAATPAPEPALDAEPAPEPVFEPAPTPAPAPAPAPAPSPPPQTFDDSG